MGSLTFSADHDVNHETPYEDHGLFGNAPTKIARRGVACLIPNFVAHWSEVPWVTILVKWTLYARMFIWYQNAHY